MPQYSYAPLTTPKLVLSKENLRDTWISIRNVIPQAAVAAAAPVAAASGILSTLGRIAAPVVSSAAKKAGTSAGNFALQHPIKALQIWGISAVGGIVGYNAIKSNPKIVSQGVPAVTGALKDAGTAVGDISKSKTFGEAYGHLKDFISEHPIASTVGAIGGLGLAGVAGLLNTAATKENTQALKSGMSATAPTTASFSAGGSGSAVGLTGDPMQSSYTSVPDTVPAKRSVSKYKRRKAKHINRSPITIRNYNIMGVKHYG